MTLRETVKQTPYKAGAIAAGIFHFVARTLGSKRSSWIGSGGYFGLLGLLIPFIIEKKSDNPTVKAFACGWRNTFIFLAIGENVYFFAKRAQDRRDEEDKKPVLPLALICTGSVMLSIKAEASENLVPVSTPGNSGTKSIASSSGGAKRVQVSVAGKKMYVKQIQ